MFIVHRLSRKKFAFLSNMCFLAFNGKHNNLTRMTQLCTHWQMFFKLHRDEKQTICTQTIYISLSWNLPGKSSITAQTKCLPCRGAWWLVAVWACGKHRRHTAQTQPGPSLPAPSTTCCKQRSPGCPGTTPRVARVQHGPAAYSGVRSTVGTARRTWRHLRPPAPRRPLPPQCEWGERRKAGRLSSSTGLLQAAGEPER